ncbi:MAG: glycosyltransferase family 39 protein [Isosphaeraceae bacterium]|nr:glycosyltransferase family 39 protein [Isosphaeraceae bacterium]
MRKEAPRSTRDADAPRWCFWVVGLSALVGLGLMLDALRRWSATYDEVAYLRVAARWWRTGDQEAITRMGSPLTFWKIQQVPVLWALDRIGLGDWIDDPEAHQAALLPLVRTWSLGIWLLAWILTATWGNRLYGPRAMAMAAALFALSPNLLAHGALVTMELPLVACTAGMFLLFWRFLRTGNRRCFWGTAILGGLAWSCKFTTVLIPPILGLAWWIAGQRRAASLPSPKGEGAGLPPPSGLANTLRVGRGMLAFLLVMVLSNWVLTGFALMPLSQRAGAHPSLDGRFGPLLGRLVARAVETPLPQDWVGFATQVHHQRSGGPSYLWGEQRMTGWWYYYFVALAVKVPLSFWLLVVGRIGLGRRVRSNGGDEIIPLALGVFLLAAALGSSRNYGIRYLLPLAPLAIVWVSALAEADRWARRLALIGLLGQGGAVAAIHPHELSYFNRLAGGPAGGRHILADSNLDWGQGAKWLARLQAHRPEFRDLTFYYFGDTDPGHYGVVGRRYVIRAGADHPDLPPQLTAATSYLAVSASLAWGPWGPPGYFRRLDALRPIAWTEDGTIAIYRAADLHRLNTQAGVEWGTPARRRPGAPKMIQREPL